MINTEKRTLTFFLIYTADKFRKKILENFERLSHTKHNENPQNFTELDLTPIQTKNTTKKIKVQIKHSRVLLLTVQGVVRFRHHADPAVRIGRRRWPQVLRHFRRMLLRRVRRRRRVFAANRRRRPVLVLVAFYCVKLVR